MYLKVGGAIRPFVEANVEPTYRLIYDGQRRIVKTAVTFAIDGRIVLQDGASQRAMTQAIELMFRQFSQPNPDIILLEDDGSTESAIKLRRQDCLLGPEVVELSLPSNEGRVYSVSAPYRITVTAEISRASGANPIVAFSEMLADLGTGGWEKVYVGGAINPPEEQIAQQFTTYKYVQQGSAVGMFGYPTIPPPIFPRYLKRPRPRVERMGPEILGNVPQNYRISWAYEYESAWELRGFPHNFTL